MEAGHRPVYDFPLTLCDRGTVEYEFDTTAMDIVTHNYANENTRVYFDESHKWYYWHGLQVDEVIAFIQADSAAEDRGGMMKLFLNLQRTVVLTLQSRCSSYGFSGSAEC